ncbi:hypothetical protein T4B_10616 [Trichinella pseudospiralis]|uniref:Uncharacterized protein n=1 Tax=Trichinella pseudospiralis TaxID=6337 RepID=A0A0V1IDJ2_TRIPS|nr:hypothetical protein T4B_10616 [Trichinella pseudospiralis]
MPHWFCKQGLLSHGILHGMTTGMRRLCGGERSSFSIFSSHAELFEIEHCCISISSENILHSIRFLSSSSSSSSPASFCFLYISKFHLFLNTLSSVQSSCRKRLNGVNDSLSFSTRATQLRVRLLFFDS